MIQKMLTLNFISLCAGAEAASGMGIPELRNGAVFCRRGRGRSSFKLIFNKFLLYPIPMFIPKLYICASTKALCTDFCQLYCCSFTKALCLLGVLISVENDFYSLYSCLRSISLSDLSLLSKL